MTKTIGSLIIGSALIWGATIIGVAAKLKGLEVKGDVVQLMGLASGMHLILIWGPAAAMIKKMKLGEGKVNEVEKKNEEF
ncbi:MAG: hypothetical protein KAS62_00345 [Candidatus Delongbacteria bacterium]|nr:hypothetical protein [Candidatus Delongbacteria bacterium]